MKTEDLLPALDTPVATVGRLVLAPDGTILAVDEPVEGWFYGNDLIGTRFADLYPELPDNLWSTSEAGAVVSAMLQRFGRLRDVVLELAVPSPETGQLHIRFEERTGALDTPAALDTHMRIVSGVVAELAHDLNNPLTGIVAALDTTLEFEKLSVEAYDLITGARQEVLRVAQIIRRARQRTRGEVPAIEMVDVHAAIEEVLQPMRAELSRRAIAVDLAVSPTMIFFQTDPIELKSIMMNLVLNARDATARHGQKISVSGERISLPQGEWLRLRVQDDGRGMMPTVLRQAGTLLYTTKRAGSGIGLAAVRRSVADAGGGVLLRSELGQGTCATVFVREGGERRSTSSSVATAPLEHLAGGNRSARRTKPFDGSSTGGETLHTSTSSQGEIAS